MRRTTVTVNDRMQRNYRYECTAPVGLGFDPEFRPELTPPELLRLGVFDGKYMTDCRGEFPSARFREAKLSRARPDPSLNYFGVDASQPLLVWRLKGWIDPSRQSARLVPVLLPAPHGATTAGRGCPPDQALEGDPAPRAVDRDQLRAGRHLVPQTATAGAAPLGLRQPQAMERNSGVT